MSDKPKPTPMKPVPTPASPELIEVLESLNAMVRAGNVRALCVLGECTSGATLEGYCLPPKTDHLQLVGLMESLKIRILDGSLDHE